MAWIVITCFLGGLNLALWFRDGSALNLFSAGFSFGVALCLIIVRIGRWRI